MPRERVLVEKGKEKEHVIAVLRAAIALIESEPLENVVVAVGYAKIEADKQSGAIAHYTASAPPLMSLISEMTQPLLEPIMNELVKGNGTPGGGPIQES